MAVPGSQSTEMTEATVVIEGATYYTRIDVPAHLAITGPAGEFQHSKERERRFVRMSSNHDSEAPKTYAPRDPNEGRTVLLVRDHGILDAFGDGEAGNATGFSDEDIKSIFNLIYFRSRQVKAATMATLLKNHGLLTYKRKAKQKAIKDMQTKAQCSVVTTYIFKLAECLREKYRTLDSNARDPATVELPERQRMIRALWNHGDGKKVIAFRMWYPVAHAIDFDAIFDPSEGIEQEVAEAMRGWRSYLWHCFHQAMDKALTLRLLARDPGKTGKTVKQADEMYFGFWRNLDKVPGWVTPELGMIPITREFGEEDEDGDDENGEGAEVLLAGDE